MTHVSELIISVKDLYYSGVPNEAIAGFLNVTEEMVESIINAYCNDEDE
jgi:orotate phosphoribosyltransferase-like protein